MAELETAQRHRHPAFDICRLKHERWIFDNRFEVGVEILEHKVEVLLDREHVQ